jgi:flagellar basal-body rod protein FlgG
VCSNFGCIRVNTLDFGQQVSRCAPISLSTQGIPADSLGMERGLYIAASGMLSALVRQDTIASNLANVNTVGYKRDKVGNEAFNDLFLYNMKTGQPVGELGLGTRVTGVYTDFSQGAFRNTESPMDVAIGGDGFFVVQGANGVAYTRAGQFSRTPNGFMTTQQGELVLGTNRQPIFVGQGDPTIASDGRVYNAGGQLVGQLAVVTLDIPNARKIGGNLWQGTETGGMPAGTELRQGFVEASKVNSIEEMVDMITTLRSYESSQRVVTSIDSTLDKAVNSVGAVQ